VIRASIEDVAERAHHSRMFVHTGGLGNKMGALLLMLLFMMLVFPTLSFGETALSQKCMDSMDAFRYAMNSVRVENVEYSLRTGQSTYYALIVSKVDKSKASTKEGLYAPWRLLERQGQSLNYCLVAAGERMEALASVQFANPKKKYGMPGSGYQRCSDGGDLMDGVDVRLWANKELGESFTLYLHSDISEKNFTFLLSNDDHWILIDELKNDPSKACYYARGDNIISHDDLQAPPLPNH
jgi:hypothetical protein